MCSTVGWAAAFCNPTLQGLYVGLTIKPLAQPTLAEGFSACPQSFRKRVIMYSTVGWAAAFCNPTLRGLYVGLTIKPLAQPTFAEGFCACPQSFRRRVIRRR